MFIDNAIIKVIDHKGRRYLAPTYHARRDPGYGPGWYVFGRSFDEYAPAGIVMRCAQPDVKLRAHPHYNCKVQRGWLTLREAQAVAAMMNAGNTIARPAWCL